MANIRCLVFLAVAVACAASSYAAEIKLQLKLDIPARCINNSVTPVSCAYVTSGDRLLPHPDDCELFYYCVSPLLPPVCRQCPAGLHFNPVKHVCDRPEEAGCEVSTSTPSYPTIQ